MYVVVALLIIFASAIMYKVGVSIGRKRTIEELINRAIPDEKVGEVTQKELVINTMKAVTELCNEYAEQYTRR